jgi:tRNA1(Val) A37 N6-methylase TrmN6
MKPCKNAELHLRLPCPVCKGVGHLISKRNLNGKIYRPFKDLKSHIDPFYTSTLEAGVALTSLCRNWFIHQIQCGHRITSDDYVCAAFGCRHFLKSGLPRPKTYLDLGTGLGSVLMLVISGLDLNMDTVIHGVEIQERHVQLARQSLALNTLNATIFHSDLREFCPEITYDLITATPPYFPASSGSLPISANRAQCAFELNGDVSDYLALASKCLSKTSSARIVLANGGHVSRTINAGIES